MITADSITEIGTFNKPHGINGEISATFLCDIEDVTELSCLIINDNGINVPFFIKAVRPKNAQTILVKIEGIDSDADVKQFMGKTVYALKNEIGDDDGDGDETDAYAFIGYKIICPNGEVVGTISDIEDSTDNYLFIVDSNEESGRTFYIPIADEFVIDFSETDKTIIMELPDGLLDM